MNFIQNLSDKLFNRDCPVSLIYFISFLYGGAFFVGLTNIIILGIYNILRLTCMVDIYNFSVALNSLRSIFTFGYFYYYLCWFYDYFWPGINSKPDFTSKEKIYFIIMEIVFKWLWFVYPILQLGLLLSIKYNQEPNCLAVYRSEYRLINLVIYQEFIYLFCWMSRSLYGIVDYFYSDDFIGIDKKQEELNILKLHYRLNKIRPKSYSFVLI
jgi:hypothetical protein